MRRNLRTRSYTHLLLCEPRTYPHNVDHIPLHNTNIGEVATTQCIQLFALSLPLLLLLCQALVTNGADERRKARQINEWIKGYAWNV